MWALATCGKGYSQARIKERPEEEGTILGPIPFHKTFISRKMTKWQIHNKLIFDNNLIKFVNNFHQLLLKMGFVNYVI